ncbi:hypothetical protein Taro_004508 [Colocasia esculenta]|uniref:Uncharacterized protein n=1 Tax=Colocasia esculenta TaxID=4460 RepID=A0A843TRU7_COLES|nr:hypothetical protein [Colocasia esculenta]
MCRVVNATALGVTFLLPPLSVDVCMHAKCRALGGLLTSSLGRQRSPRSRSCRNGVARRDPNRCAVFKNPSRTEQGKLCSARGSCYAGGASALVILMKRVAHEMGMFDPFVVCPGVGTVVTAVVACVTCRLRFHL